MVRINVHRDPKVESLINLYGELLTASNYEMPIREHLALLSDRLLEGHKNQHVGVGFVIGRKFKKMNLTDVFSESFTQADARNCVTQDFGYKDWNDVVELKDLTPDPDFELLVDKLLAGDIKAVKEAIEKNPELVRQHSSYPHKSTLLHYTGSNGVEGYRQVVPENLPSILDLLLAHGADINLEAQIYGGCTAENLMKTSKHPHDSGLYSDLQSVFDRYQKNIK